jgi:hypothetical protein
MAYFSNDIDYRTVAGQFENEFARFEYRANTRTDINDFPHEIAMSDGSFRFAKVLKTVVYVVTDEDEYGQPVVEKWNIKPIWARIARGANFNCCAQHGILPDDYDDSAF